MQQLTTIPIGGEHITNDLALGLRTSILAAENLKLEHGRALLALADSEPKVEISSIGSREKRLVSEKDCRYIEPRVQEISDRPRRNAEDGVGATAPAGVVLSGGVSAMPGILDVAAIFLRATESAWPVRLHWDSKPNLCYRIGLLYYIYRHQPRFFCRTGKNSRTRRVKVVFGKAEGLVRRNHLVIGERR